MVTRVRKSNFAQGAITTEKLNQSSFTCNLFDITEYDSIGAFPTDTTTVGALGYIAGDSAADSDKIYGNIGRGWYRITGIESSCYRYANMPPIDVLLVGGGGLGGVNGARGNTSGGGGGGVVAFQFCPTLGQTLNNSLIKPFSNNVDRSSGCIFDMEFEVGAGGSYAPPASTASTDPIFMGKPTYLCTTLGCYVAPGGEAGGTCVGGGAGSITPCTDLAGGRSGYYADGCCNYAACVGYRTLGGQCIRANQCAGCGFAPGWSGPSPTAVCTCFSRGGGGAGAATRGQNATPAATTRAAGCGGDGYLWCDGCRYGGGGGGAVRLPAETGSIRGEGGAGGGGPGQCDGYVSFQCRVVCAPIAACTKGIDYTGGGGGGGWSGGKTYGTDQIGGGAGGHGVAKIRFATGSYCDPDLNRKFWCATGTNVICTDSSDGYTYVEFRCCGTFKILDPLVGFDS